jgi:hypothetical protein
MGTPINSLLQRIAAIGNSRINEKTIPDLRKLQSELMDFADSVVPKNHGQEAREDFDDALNQLMESIDNLDLACDDYDLADENESREEALESAGEALVDIGAALQELSPLALYVETTEKTVAAKFSAELKHLSALPAEKVRGSLDLLLIKARTPKETSMLLTLAKEAMFSGR